MTKAEIDTIQNVIARLKAEGREADEVKEALHGPARLWFETWVIGPLELLLPGDGRDPKLALRLSK